MREWVKVSGVVALLALLAIDVGTSFTMHSRQKNNFAPQGRNSRGVVINDQEVHTKYIMLDQAKSISIQLDDTNIAADKALTINVIGERSSHESRECSYVDSRPHFVAGAIYVMCHTSNVDTEVWIAIGTLALVIVTFMLFVATKRLADTTVALGSDAKQASVIDMRAYVAVGFPRMNRENASSKIVASFDIVNSGRTPAIDVYRTSNIVVLPYPLVPQHEFFNYLTPGRFVIFPNKSVEAKHVMNDFISNKDIVAIREGKSRIYIHGTVKYRDVFGHCHHTSFCMYIAETEFADWYDAISDGQINNLCANWHYADTHNDVS